MSYVLEDKSAVEPSLTQMSIKALDMLQEDNKDGYILLVEAARIDHAHHDNLGRMALEETAEMHRAVEAIMERIDLRDTLVIVTSDHSHTLTVGGYPPRGTDILGKGDFSREDEMPLFTLSYANGMSHWQHVDAVEGGRRNPLGMDYHNKWFVQPATVPLEDETHGGDDVAVFAAGPYAQLFTGEWVVDSVVHVLLSCDKILINSDFYYRFVRAALYRPWNDVCRVFGKIRRDRRGWFRRGRRSVET